MQKLREEGIKITMTAKHPRFSATEDSKPTPAGEHVFVVFAKYTVFGASEQIKLSRPDAMLARFTTEIVRVSYAHPGRGDVDIDIAGLKSTRGTAMVMECLQYVQNEAYESILREFNEAGIVYDRIYKDIDKDGRRAKKRIATGTELDKSKEAIALTREFQLAISHNDAPVVEAEPQLPKEEDASVPVSSAVPVQYEEKEPEPAIVDLPVISRTAAPLPVGRQWSASTLLDYELTDDAESYQTSKGFESSDSLYSVFDTSAVAEKTTDDKFIGVYIHDKNRTPFFVPTLSDPNDHRIASLAAMANDLISDVRGMFKDAKKGTGFMVGINVVFVDEESEAFFKRWIKNTVFTPLLADGLVPYPDVFVQYVNSSSSRMANIMNRTEIFPSSPQSANMLTITYRRQIYH